MTWRDLVSRLPIGSHRRGLATATLYGLSLAVRFTPAAGEDGEMATQSLQMIKPVTSVMIRTAPQLPFEGLAKAAQPIVLRPGWPLGSSDCRTGM